MNGWFLAAAALSAFTCAIHIVLGGREAAQPLLAAPGLSRQAKFTNYYCWHLVTIAIASMSAAFACCSWSGRATELSSFTTATALLFALWNFVMIRRFRLSFLEFPQWALFLPIGILGAIGGIA